MLRTLKEYFEEFSLLPNPVKMFICAALFITFCYGIFAGTSNFLNARKIAQLETQNFDLNRTSNEAQKRATFAETNAANESLRAAALENQLKTLESEINKSDEKINLQSQKSISLRDSLRVVRNSSPANTSTDDLERRLKERYRQSEPR